MKGTKLRPLHDRLVVKRLPEEEVTKGGIIQFTHNVPFSSVSRFKPDFSRAIYVYVGHVWSLEKPRERGEKIVQKCPSGHR